MVFTAKIRQLILTAPKECQPFQVNSHYFTTRILIVSKAYFYEGYYPVNNREKTDLDEPQPLP